MMVGVEYGRSMGHTNSVGQALYIIETLEANGEAMCVSKRVEIVATDSSTGKIEENGEERR
jgi:hypothetical protein